MKLRIGTGPLTISSCAGWLPATTVRPPPGGDLPGVIGSADFVGWYGDVIHRVTGVAKSDTFRLYLAYHEGPNGYRRRTFDAKPWLLGVARKVDDRAERYAAQYATCGGPPVAGR